MCAWREIVDPPFVTKIKIVIRKKNVIFVMKFAANLGCSVTDFGEKCTTT